MADLPARNSMVYASAAGSVYTAVGGVKDISFDLTGAADETTDHDSGAFKEFMAGRGELKMTFNANYDEADAGQGIVRTAAFGRSTCYFKFRAAVGGGYKESYANGVVTGFKPSAGNDGPVALAVDVQLSGVPTDTAQ